MRQTKHIAISLALLVLLPALLPAAAQDSGTGIDFQFGSLLDPSGQGTSQHCDPRDESWLRGDRHRTPTGALYRCPPEQQAPSVMSGEEWLHWGEVELGWLGTSGDTENMQWLRYQNWDDGFILGFLGLDWLRPADGTYINIRASRLSDDNQYIKATFGRAGKYRVEVFGKSQPNVVAGHAHSIWNGIGSDNLTLVDGLTPAGSTPEEVAAASAASPARILKVVRDKQGVGINYTFNRAWSAYLKTTYEQREGSRPFGGPFFFNFAFPNNGGAFETPRPIDDSTINVNGGLRFVGSLWRMEMNYSGSFYRSADTGWQWEVPFALYPVVPGAVSSSLTNGSFASEPDNNYHNLRFALTRQMPMNGELSMSLAGGTMRQDDDLLPPIDCQGTFGIDLSPTGSPVNPFLFDCANWNTTDALSQKTAEMRIDTSHFDMQLVLQPNDRTTVRASTSFHREDYRHTYLAYNPLTGQYGYVAENGSQGSVVPGEAGIFDPVTAPSVLTRVRSLPLDKQTIDFTLGVNFRPDRRNSFGVAYTRTSIERDNREREQVDDDLIKLNWTNRATDWLTFRANYSYLRQSGDTYNYDPYEFTFSTSLPGFIGSEATLPPHTVDALRKYDVGSRDESKFTFIATFMPSPEVSLNATVRGDWNDYDAELGRQQYDTLGASLSLDWQPMLGTNVSAYGSWDRSKLLIANVNESVITPTDPTLGGAVYTEGGRWWVDDNQRNYNAGVTFDHQFRRMRLDANWNWIRSRGITDYRFASAVALAYPGLADVAGSAYPAMTYSVHSLDLGLNFNLNERLSMRLFDRYERGKMSDWHYLGLEDGLVIDHRVYLDSGPSDYESNLVGVLLKVKL